LPDSCKPAIERQLLVVARQHNSDLLRGAGDAPTPNVLYRKYPSASAMLGWQYVFPPSVLRPWHDDKRLVHWHTSTATVQKAFKRAVTAAGIHKVLAFTVCAIRSLLTFWLAVLVSVAFNSCLGTKICKPQ
jgi:hypothetical protein